MKVDVTKERVAITECHVVTEGEYCVNECEFQLSDCFDGLTVTAVFNDIPVPLLNNRCFIPSLKKGGAVLGVYAYRKNGEELELVYSPKPTAFYVDEGSYTGASGVEETPEISRYEEYCTMLSQLCENLISQIDYVSKSSLTQEISSQCTHSQVPTAKAVFDSEKEINQILNENVNELTQKQTAFMGAVSNALKGEKAGNILVIDDVSPVAHNIECGFKAKNISSVSTTGEFTQRKQITFNNTFPSGVYSFSAVVESSDTDSNMCLFSFTLNGASKKAVTIERSVDGKRVALQNVFIPTEFNGISFYSSVSNAGSIGDTAIVKDIQLEKGELATEYMPYADLVGASVIVAGKNLCNVNDIECTPSSDKAVSYNAVKLNTTLPAGCYSFSSKVESNDTDTDKCLMLLINEDEDGTQQEVCRCYFSRDDESRAVVENQSIEKPFNCICFYAAGDYESSVNDSASFTDFQIESGSVATDFDAFEAMEILKINEECKINNAQAVYPTTTIIPEQNGILIEAVYNRDINKAFAELQKAVGM